MSQHLKLRKAATGRFDKVDFSTKEFDLSRKGKSFETFGKKEEEGTELVSMSTINFNRMMT